MRGNETREQGGEQKIDKEYAQGGEGKEEDKRRIYSVYLERRGKSISVLWNLRLGQMVRLPYL